MAMQASAQTNRSMKEENREKELQYYYSEKEMDKVSAYIEQQYGDFD